MKKLLITLIIVLSFLSVSAQKQSGKLDKQVEVTKDYIPDVNNAIKLAVSPRMVDTVSLRPEIDYYITSSAWLGEFGISAINPVKFSSTSFKSAPFLYIKTGLSYPSGTLFDSYIAGGDGETSIYGAYINHNGDYGNIANDIGHSISALTTNNEFAVFGAKRWDRIEFGMSAGYKYDLFTDYGQFQLPSEPLADYGPLNANRISYQTPEASIWFGNDFKNLDRFNFRIGADAYYLMDNASSAELGVSAGLKLGKRFSKMHTLLLSVDYDLYSGKDLLKGYTNNIVTVAPHYRVETHYFLMNFGAEVAFDKVDGLDAKFRVLPKVDIEFNAFNSYITPFISIDGRLKNNNLRSIIDENPYRLPIPVVENSEFYDLMAGVKGNFTPSTKYKINVGYTLMRDYMAVANLYQDGSTSRFVHVTSLTDNGNCFTVGGEVVGQINNRFYYDISANYYKYKMDRVEYASGRANYDAELNLKYAFSDSFRARIGTQLIGDRYFYVLNNVLTGGSSGSVPRIITEKVAPVVNLNVGLDLDVSRRTSIFLEANNILDSKLYQYNHYPSIGLSCTLGVKIAF